MKPLKIKLFADGANLNSIIELAKDSKISGFTTNPTLMRKAGITDYTAFAKEVLQHIKDRPISFEVFSDDISEMETQAYKIASWGDNVYVKIPITNTKSESTIPLIQKLSHSNVKVNVTAVFTLKQVRESVDALKGGSDSVISIFAGRIADAGVAPMPIMKKALAMCKESSNIELLWASPREVYNVIEAEKCGCHIITATPDILAKIKNFGKDLTEFSLDTVLMFRNDSVAAGYTI